MTRLELLDLAAATIELNTGDGARTDPWTPGYKNLNGDINYERVAGAVRQAMLSERTRESADSLLMSLEWLLTKCPALRNIRREDISRDSHEGRCLLTCFELVDRCRGRK